MTKLPYHLVDVFTNIVFGGNPLAVFPDGHEVPEGMMQSIANELNLSETTFVLPPRDEKCDFRLRIFTPQSELPIAGHPTVGSAFVLASEKRIAINEDKACVIFEEGVGPIPVSLRFKGDSPGQIIMEQPLPEFGDIFPDKAGLAKMLSLEPKDLVSELPSQVVSCGLPFLFIPVAGLAAIKRASLRMDIWEKLLKGFSTSEIFLYTKEVESLEATVHSRMFAPRLGVPEDPATGVASGPLGAYLVNHGIIPCQERVEIISEQGFEMGRRSFIHITIEKENEIITKVEVGGECVPVGGGWIQLP